MQRNKEAKLVKNNHEPDRELVAAKLSAHTFDEKIAPH